MDELFKLGNYDIKSIIGRGAMGIVYKAFDPTIQQEVAIKTIRKDILEAADKASDTQIADRFRMEVLAGRKLKHANIVRIYEYGTTEDCYYIVMEFVQGRSLHEYFQAGRRFEIDATLRIMQQMLDALGYAHRQGVIHRDIKPANVMLSEDDTVQIADFGVAKVFEAGSSTLTGYAVGTPSYMAPEQWQVDTPPDARADLFSVGIIFYQLLTGRHPFRGATTPETVEKIRSHIPPNPSQIEPAVPKIYDEVVKRALQKDPHGRYQTAEDFAQDLRTLEAYLESRAPRIAAAGTDRLLSTTQSVAVMAGSLALGLTLAWFAVSNGDLDGNEGAVQRNVDAGAVTPKATTDDPEAALRTMAADFSCSHLEIDPQGAGNGRVRGFVLPKDLGDLKQRMAASNALASLEADIRGLDWPYCEIFSLLSPFKRGDKWRFAEEQNTRHYVEGDPLVLALKAPNYVAHVYVDYFQLDGSVVHLFPLSAADNKPQTPGAAISIGNTADGNHEWRIQPPFGTEMIVVMASAESLFGVLRPEHEHAKDYLHAVRTAIDDGHRKRVTADYYFIQSQAKH